MALDPVEAFDYTSEMLYPHLTWSEQAVLARNIRGRHRDELLLLAPTALNVPAVVAGLTTEQIETIMRLGSLNQKTALISAFDTPEQITEIETVARALGQEAGKSAEAVSRELTRIRWYVADHRSLFIVAES